MKPTLSNPVKLILILAALMMAGEILSAQTTSSSSTNTNLALGKTATASSLENTGMPASNAFDGDQNTRFSSGFSDNEWISVDLGKASLIKTVVLTWERAYGTDFNILFSNNGTFTDLYIDSIQVRNNVLSGNSVAGTNTISMKSNTIARYVRMQGVKRFTQYGYSLWEMQVMGTSGSGSSLLLPVSLTDFAISKQAGSNTISFTTLYENNNAGFSIERSEDGNGFSSIGWIAGQNKGSVVLKYSFTDKQPLTGKAYYRIKQVDADGKASYSSVLSVNNTNNATAAMRAYPVPVTDHLVVEYKANNSERINISLFNAAGQPMYANSINVNAGLQTMSISRTAAMKAGTYFLKLTSDNNSYTQQLVIQ